MKKTLSQIALVILYSSYLNSEKQLFAAKAQEMDSIASADISDMVLMDDLQLRRLAEEDPDVLPGADSDAPAEAATTTTIAQDDVSDEEATAGGTGEEDTQNLQVVDSAPATSTTTTTPASTEATPAAASTDTTAETTTASTEASTTTTSAEPAAEGAEGEGTEGGEERTEQQVQQDVQEHNNEVQRDFERQGVDTSADLTDDQLREIKNQKYADKVKKHGAVIELLEPRARQFINVPQKLAPLKRKNCKLNTDGKTHYLTSQGSKNYVQWRTKRAAKQGNCTIKVSTDGRSFTTIVPVGWKGGNSFPCGRSVGYESVVIKLPNKFVSENDRLVILQLEMYTYLGVIVQCSDMLVQKQTGFQNQKCDPHCKNGGVCQGGVCKCGLNFYGDSCEFTSGASGAFSLLLFIFVIALVLAAIGLLYARANLERDQKRQLAMQQEVPR